MVEVVKVGLKELWGSLGDEIDVRSEPGGKEATGNHGDGPREVIRATMVGPVVIGFRKRVDNWDLNRAVSMR